jgi:catechol 2,3-dioxygenase-like lactoylglutathione lyase family enzyme
MIDHVGLTVSNFNRARKFYTAALGPLGYRAGFTDEKAGVLGMFGKDGSSLWLSRGNPRDKVHIAIRVAGRPVVRKFYATALKAGGRDNGAPGPRPQYTPTYYAAFVRDPDGHNVEAVCLKKA